MVMPYTAIQFTVLHKLKSFVSGSSKTGLNISAPSVIFMQIRSSYLVNNAFVFLYDDKVEIYCSRLVAWENYY